MSRRVLVLIFAVALLAGLAPHAAFALAADDDAPGTALTGGSGTVLDSVDGAADPEDWYNIALAEGDQLTLSLTGGTGTDFSISLFRAPDTDEWTALFWLWMWDGPYPRETSYVVPQGAAGTYYVRVHSTAGQGLPGMYTLKWAKTHDVTARLYGMDRYQTAAAVSRSSFAESTAAVIASGENFPDALAASGLAGVLRAPVLLTRKAYVPNVVLREIQRLKATQLYVIGSESAVSATAAAELAALEGCTVDRIGGADRFETSALVASRISSLGGRREAFLVTGWRYPDALSVSAAAFARRMPVLLTRPEVLSPATKTALESLGTTHVVVAGSTAAVGQAPASSAAVICATNDTGKGHLLERWEGIDRFATAVAVAQHARTLGWTGWANVALATGWNFPDALGGGAAIGARGGNLLLTRPDVLTPATGDALHAARADVDRVYLLGSTSAVSNRVASDVAAELAP